MVVLFFRIVFEHIYDVSHNHVSIHWAYYLKVLCDLLCTNPFANLHHASVEYYALDWIIFCHDILELSKYLSLCIKFV